MVNYHFVVSRYLGDLNTEFYYWKCIDMLQLDGPTFAIHYFASLERWMLSGYFRPPTEMVVNKTIHHLVYSS